MSKEKPEVGDVFADTRYPNVKMRVLGKSGTPNTYDALGTDGKDISHFICCTFEADYYTYLGKSKVNIKELFDIKEKENGI